MTPIPNHTLTEALHWRYATKKFDETRKIPAATWAALEEALVLAPSSFGLQPWNFIVVQNQETKAKLSAAAHHQHQPSGCSHFVVFAGRREFNSTDVDRYLARTAEVRNLPLESLKAYGDVMKGSIERAAKAGHLDEWMGKQAYIALGGFMTAAALLGVDTCPMEGIDKAMFDDILGLHAKGCTALCACAAGYRAPDDKYSRMPKVRFKGEDVVIHA